MKKIVLLSSFALLLGSFDSQAQTEKPKKVDKNAPVEVQGFRITPDGNSDFDEIIIRKKGEKNSKVTIEINGEKVIVNGKPIESFDDVNVAVIKRKTPRVIAGTAGSQFRTVPDGVIVQGYPLIGDGMAPSIAYGGPSNKAILGVTTEKANDGVKVQRVSEKSGAEKAGLKEGDIITKINDDQIGDPTDLSLVIGKYKPEDKVTVTYKRDGKVNTTSATLGKNPGSYSTINEFRTESYDLDKIEGFPSFDNFRYNFDSFGDRGNTFTTIGRPRLGIKAQETEEGVGVKVLQIWDESLAQKAGIKEGDIITSFDGKKTNTTDELVEAAKESKDKPAVKVELNRDGKTQTVEIKTPKKLKTANL